MVFGRTWPVTWRVRGGGGCSDLSSPEVAFALPRPEHLWKPAPLPSSASISALRLTTAHTSPSLTLHHLPRRNGRNPNRLLPALTFTQRHVLCRGCHLNFKSHQVFFKSSRKFEPLIYFELITVKVHANLTWARWLVSCFLLCENSSLNYR